MRLEFIQMVQKRKKKDFSLSYSEFWTRLKSILANFSATCRAIAN